MNNSKSMLAGRVVNLIFVVDTEQIYLDFEDEKTSLDDKNPIIIGSQYVYMVFDNGEYISGSKNERFVIDAKPNDRIRWSGMSESGNFSSSLLVYGLSKESNANVFSEPSFELHTAKSMFPVQNGPFPVTYTDQVYWFLQSNINKKGNEKYKILFALYNARHGAQELFGYFGYETGFEVS